MTKVYTAKELAQMARARGRPVTTGYIRRLCRDRRIPGAYKIGPAWVITHEQAEKWLAEYTRAE